MKSGQSFLDPEDDAHKACPTMTVVIDKLEEALPPSSPLLVKKYGRTRIMALLPHKISFPSCLCFFYGATSKERFIILLGSIMLN